MNFYRSKQVKFILILLLVLFSQSSCTSSDSNRKNELIKNLEQKNETLNKEVLSLKDEIKKLNVKIEELSITPTNLMYELKSHLNEDNQNIKKAEEVLGLLNKRFPDSPESKEGEKLLNKYYADLKAREIEEKRLAALGFKALKVNSQVSNENTTFKLINTKVSDSWTFDSHGDSYMYTKAEKGDKYVTARVSVTSKDKDPNLMGVGIYSQQGAKLTLVETMWYKFVRWKDYGTYLGNHTDFNNDFAHTSTIPFTLGASVSSEILKNPIYLVITKEGCHSRGYKRFENPPVYYLPNSCTSLKRELLVKDFSDKSLEVLKVVN